MMVGMVSVSATPQGRRKPGSQPALRDQNIQRVLQTLERRGPTTQAKLARLTGLSTGTISNIVRELDSTSRVRTTPVVDSGRRAISVTLLGDERAFVGLDLSGSQIKVLVARADRSVLGRAEHPVPPNSTPESLLELAHRVTERALSTAGLTSTGVTMAVAGVAPPTPDSDTPGQDDWTLERLSTLAAARFDHPINFERAGTLGALAQITWGPYETAGSLAYVHLGAEVTCGLVIGEIAVRGQAGLAGDLAHLPVVSPGEFCRCGNRGCLNTVMSEPLLVQGIRRTKRSATLSTTDLIALARSRDLPAVRLIEDAGISLGHAVATLCTVLNPAVVVIGGPLAELGAPLLDPVGRGLRRRVSPRVVASTTLTACQLGADAVSMGGVAAAVRRSLVTD